MFFFAQDELAFLDFSVCFYNIFLLFFCNSVKSIIGILVGFAFTLWMTSSTRILILIVYTQGIAFHLPVNSLISSQVAYSFLDTEILPLWLDLFLCF